MFLIYCDNKGCGKDNEPTLDLSTNQVMCSECGKEIKSVTLFTKNQMKAIGQIKRAEKKQQAFAVKCQGCNRMAAPKIAADSKIMCSMCGAHLTNLPKPFEQVIRDHIKAQRKDPQ